MLEGNLSEVFEGRWRCGAPCLGLDDAPDLDPSRPWQTESSGLQGTGISPYDEAFFLASSHGK